MKEFLPYCRESSIYPGEFIPLQQEVALYQKLKSSGEENTSKPLVNMNEYKDYYTIEAILPGVRREDIFIQTIGNKLSITVLNEGCENVQNKWQIHEFENKCFERHIVLPDNADTEFVSAEYRKGILWLHIPKTEEQQVFHTGQIVVY